MTITPSNFVCVRVTHKLEQTVNFDIFALIGVENAEKYKLAKLIGVSPVCRIVSDLEELHILEHFLDIVFGLILLVLVIFKRKLKDFSYWIFFDNFRG